MNRRQCHQQKIKLQSVKPSLDGAMAQGSLDEAMVTPAVTSARRNCPGLYQGGLVLRACKGRLKAARYRYINLIILSCLTEGSSVFNVRSTAAKHLVSACPGTPQTCSVQIYNIASPQDLGYQSLQFYRKPVSMSTLLIEDQAALFLSRMPQSICSEVRLYTPVLPKDHLHTTSASL